MDPMLRTINPRMPGLQIPFFLPICIYVFLFNISIIGCFAARYIYKCALKKLVAHARAACLYANKSAFDGSGEGGKMSSCKNGNAEGLAEYIIFWGVHCASSLRYFGWHIIDI